MYKFSFALKTAGGDWAKSASTSACPTPNGHWKQKLVAIFQTDQNKKRAAALNAEAASRQHDQEMETAGGDVDSADGGCDQAWLDAGGVVPQRQASINSSQPTSSGAASRTQLRAINKRTKNQNRLVIEKLVRGFISAGIPANAFNNKELQEGLDALANFGPKFKMCDASEVYPMYVSNMLYVH